jgi:hypothetical protein
MWPRSLSAVVAVTAALTGLASASSGADTPARIKIPKVTRYPVKVDVAGYVDLDWAWDSTRPCAPGYVKTVNEELSFELGKPRRSTVTVVNGKVTMPAAIGGQAKLKAALERFGTSNYCPPTVPDPPRPVCKTLGGKLGVTLGPEKLTKEEKELSPLAGQPVLILLTRHGGGRQTYSCASERPTPRAIDAGRGVRMETLLVPTASWIAVPIKPRSLAFSELKRGERLSTKVKIRGRCDRIAAHASALPEGITNCTVRGKIVVTIKRVK